MQRHHLDRETQLRAIGMIQGGMNIRDVAEAVHSTKSTIGRLWQRFEETGDVRERHTGPTRATQPVHDRFIRLQAVRNPNVTASQLRSELQNVHDITVTAQTIRNRLHENTLHSRRPIRVPVLSRGNRTTRLRWAEEHQNWQEQDWAHILFTDESRFGLRPDSRRIRVWRRPGNASRLETIHEVDRYQGGTLMIWAGVSLGFRTDLVLVEGFLTANQYRDNILEPIVRPHAARIGENFILMHDNARPHVARTVRHFLEQHNIEVLPWPAQSPDLNPIEHVWDMLKRRVLNQGLVFQTREELFNCLQEQWQQIDQNDIDNFIRSMPNRCRAVINNRGGHTLY